MQTHRFRQTTKTKKKRQRTIKMDSPNEQQSPTVTRSKFRSITQRFTKPKENNSTLTASSLPDSPTDSHFMQHSSNHSVSSVKSATHTLTSPFRAIARQFKSKPEEKPPSMQSPFVEEKEQPSDADALQHLNETLSHTPPRASSPDTFHSTSPQLQQQQQQQQAVVAPRRTSECFSIPEEGQTEPPVLDSIYVYVSPQVTFWFNPTVDVESPSFPEGAQIRAYYYSDREKLYVRHTMEGHNNNSNPTGQVRIHMTNDYDMLLSWKQDDMTWTFTPQQGMDTALLAVLLYVCLVTLQFTVFITSAMVFLIVRYASSIYRTKLTDCTIVRRDESEWMSAEKQIALLKPHQRHTFDGLRQYWTSKTNRNGDLVFAFTDMLLLRFTRASLYKLSGAIALAEQYNTWAISNDLHTMQGVDDVVTTDVQRLAVRPLRTRDFDGNSVVYIKMVDFAQGKSEQSTRASLRILAFTLHTLLASEQIQGVALVLNFAKFKLNSVEWKPAFDAWLDGTLFSPLSARRIIVVNFSYSKQLVSRLWSVVGNTRIVFADTQQELGQYFPDRASYPVEIGGELIL